MTKSTQSDMQLTTDGGEVKHRPPTPRMKCPECWKMVALTRAGFWHKHSGGYGEECPTSGRRPDR
jgi:hypothetical protein